MCILTYIPLKNGFLFTSNRDEQLQRATQDPKFYIRKEQRLLYPKDAKKGGTWFAVHPKKRSAVSLLNAKDEEGSVNPSSTQSRGKMPLKLLIEGNEFRKFLTSKLAPFCMISISNPSRSIKLTSYRWDRKNLEILSLDPSKPYLWCSTSLYNDKEYNKIALHFQKKLRNLKDVQSVVAFHKALAQPLNSEVFLKKNSDIQTVSVTCFHKQGSQMNLGYWDLKKEYLNEKYYLF